MRVKTGASIKIPVLMVDATDGFTEETGITTPTIYISKNGAAEAAPHSGTWAEIDATNMPGQYTVNLDSTDTDTVGVIQGIVTKAGSRNFHFTLEIVANLESDVYGLVDTEVAAILEDTGTTLPATLATIAGYIDTEVASTLAAVDTEIGTLTTNLADLHTDVGTAITNIATVDGVVDAILEDTGTTIPATLATIAGYIDTEVASTLAAVDTEIGTLTTNLATVDGIVDAIKLKTDNIPATPATEAKQDAIIGYIDTEIASVLAAVDTEVASILEDTGTTIPATLATIAGYIDTEVASTLAAVDTEIGTLTTNLATIDGIVDAILEDTGTTLPATLATIDGIVDDILVDTGTTLPATLVTIAGYIDTEVASILEDTGTTIPATLATIAGYIDTEVASTLAAVDTEIGTLTTNLATVDGIVDAIKLKTDLIPASIPTAAQITDAVWDELTTDGIAMRTVMNALFAAGVCAMTFDGTTLKIKNASGSTIYTMTYSNAGGTESRTKAAEL